VYGRSSWSHRAVKDILRNDVYLGIASAGEFRNENAHEPLIDRATFEAIQWKGVQFRPRSDEPSPIRPLLRCASCRYAMRAERRPMADHDVWYFTCRSASHRTAWSCDDPAAIKDHGQLEGWIVGQLFAHVDAVQADVEQRDAGSTDLEADVERRRRLYEEWRDESELQDRLGMRSYVDGLATRQAALNDAIESLARARARDASTISGLAAVGDLQQRWATLGLADKRTLLGSAIRCVFVRGGKRDAPLDGRLHLCWQGEEVDLPARGKRNWQARPFVFPQ
jgi:hypothetical protein